jgi:hypothetical protein
LDATAALDLLKWRTQSKSDRETVEHLMMEMGNEQT